ncbi:NOG1 family protein [Desulfurococcus amylolyticus]|uniref:Small GTP-binding protein n=1 Tax=Desulfurococcus amylolyticus DSM 16532 TaxID=768672 RepID=I3XTH4_DESAM|nr:GTPase [Desulfurococcus amylolyticus]AFL67248.1 small GTP-binding protein [Desulfurococcus amylolyticus DSM 16532]
MSIKDGRERDLSRYYIKTYRELLKHVDSKLRSLRTPATTRKTILLNKLELAYRIIHDELGVIVSVLDVVDGMPEFFRELYRICVGEDPDRTRQVFKAYMRIAKEIAQKYLDEIRRGSSDPVKVFREGLGRLLSLYKRKARIIGFVKKYVSEVARMPDVSGDYRVVIAGVPQVGKSTLISKLTRAKPEIGSYPFTTRNIIVGHMVIGDIGRITLIDSPGIIDTPLEEKNIIEKRAILAVKYLADHLLFVFDVNPSFYYSIEEQLRVYEAVRKLISEKPVTLVVNKVDLVPGDILRKMVELIESRTGLKPICISALLEINMDALRKVLVEAFMAYTQRPG